MSDRLTPPCLTGNGCWRKDAMPCLVSLRIERKRRSIGAMTLSMLADLDAECARLRAESERPDVTPEGWREVDDGVAPPAGA